MIIPHSLPVAGTIYQIGVVVPNLEQGMAHYSRILGLENWKRMDTDYVGRYRNWEGRIANRNAFAPWGTIHLEMIEPGVGEGNAMEWLRTRGPGMFHLGVAVDDVRNRPDDIEVVFEVHGMTQPDGSPAIVHLDTVPLLGYFIELAWRPMAESLVARIASPEPWNSANSKGISMTANENASNLGERLAKVEAHLAIQQLAFSYARTVDSRDLAGLGELFSPSTKFENHGTGATGAIAFYDSVLTSFYRSFHQVVGHVITDITADSARGTVYCRAEHEDGDNWIVNLMVYFDRYTCVDGRWYFLGRRPRFLFVGDHTQAPRSLDFNSWPGREDRFTCELPQSDASWSAFWERHSGEAAQVTTLP